MINPKIVERDDTEEKLSLTCESYGLSNKSYINPIYIRKLDHWYQSILRQLYFDVDDIQDYEVLQYQLGKLDKLKLLLISKASSIYSIDTGTLSRNKFSKMENAERLYVDGLKDVCFNKYNEVYSFYTEIFDIKFDIVEKKLKNKMDEYEKLNEENDIQKTIQKAEEKIEKI